MSTAAPGSVFLGDPGAPPAPTYPHRSPPDAPHGPGPALTLFGAPAGRSVFSLPAGPDANVEKDGSSASLTAMSDSPGGCLINVGAQKVLGSPKEWGYPNPKVNEEEKKKT